MRPFSFLMTACHAVNFLLKWDRAFNGNFFTVLVDLRSHRVSLDLIHRETSESALVVRREKFPSSGLKAVIAVSWHNSGDG